MPDANPHYSTGHASDTRRAPKPWPCSFDVSTGEHDPECVWRPEPSAEHHTLLWALSLSYPRPRRQGSCTPWRKGTKINAECGAPNYCKADRLPMLGNPAPSQRPVSRTRRKQLTCSDPLKLTLELTVRRVRLDHSGCRPLPQPGRGCEKEVVTDSESNI